MTELIQTRANLYGLVDRKTENLVPCAELIFLSAKRRYSLTGFEEMVSDFEVVEHRTTVSKESIGLVIKSLQEIEKQLQQLENKKDA